MFGLQIHNLWVRGTSHPNNFAACCPFCDTNTRDRRTVPSLAPRACQTTQATRASTPAPGNGPLHPRAGLWRVPWPSTPPGEAWRGDDIQGGPHSSPPLPPTPTSARLPVPRPYPASLRSGGGLTTARPHLLPARETRGPRVKGGRGRDRGAATVTAKPRAALDGATPSSGRRGCTSGTRRAGAEEDA